MNAIMGADVFTALKVLQSQKLPMKNCVKVPNITDNDEDADSIPLTCGCVISATYVKI